MLANHNALHISLVFYMSQTWGCIPPYEGGGVIPILQGDVIISPIHTTNKWLCWNVNQGFLDSRNSTALTEPLGSLLAPLSCTPLGHSLIDSFLVSLALLWAGTVSRSSP